MNELDRKLEEWSVLAPGTWENNTSSVLGSWFAVANDDGIISYFSKEKDALAFRLMKINQELNS